MNIVAYKAAQLRKQELETLGFEEYRVQALQNLKLKTVIRVRQFEFVCSTTIRYADT